MCLLHVCKREFSFEEHKAATGVWFQSDIRPLNLLIAVHTETF